MMFLTDNKYSFLNMKPQKTKILILIILILIFLLILLIKCKFYDNYETKGFVSCSDTCVITTYIPTNIHYEEIYYKHQLLDYQLLSKEIKVDEKNLESYLELRLATNENLRNGEIIRINFYYQKQRLISKIKNLMF